MNRFIIILFLGFIGISSNAQTVLPKNLDGAIEYFDKNWSKKEKTDFINDFIQDSLKNVQYTIGMWIGNNWIYGNRDTIIVNYFNHLGIYHPDDMSSIILISLYRKLTNKPIGLNKQIEDYKAYRKRVDDCEQKERWLAWEKYNRLEIGNPVKIYIPIRTAASGKKFVDSRYCPNVDWTYDPIKDILLNGVLVNKSFVKRYTHYDVDNFFYFDDTTFSIKVKILKLNQDSIPWFIGATKVGDIVEIPLKYLKIEY